VKGLEAEGILRVVLATRDAHEVYRPVGFEPLANPSTGWSAIAAPNACRHRGSSTAAR
jgi:hypothetical protein